MLNQRLRGRILRNQLILVENLIVHTVHGVGNLSESTPNERTYLSRGQEYQLVSVEWLDRSADTVLLKVNRAVNLQELNAAELSSKSLVEGCGVRNRQSGVLVVSHILRVGNQFASPTLFLHLTIGREGNGESGDGYTVRVGLIQYTLDILTADVALHLDTEMISWELVVTEVHTECCSSVLIIGNGHYTIRESREEVSLVLLVNTY